MYALNHAMQGNLANRHPLWDGNTSSGFSTSHTKSVDCFRYFDGVADSCRSFLFRGCDGNINNFPTKQICDEFCASTGTLKWSVSSFWPTSIFWVNDWDREIFFLASLACPYGGEYLRRENGHSVECSSDGQCPSNYICITPVGQGCVSLRILNRS